MSVRLSVRVRQYVPLALFRQKAQINDSLTDKKAIYLKKKHNTTEFGLIE